MTGGLQRRLADFACRGLQALLPSSLQCWGSAIRRETAEIDDDTEALFFAFGSVFGLMSYAVTSSLIGKAAVRTGEPSSMNFYEGAMQRPRTIGIACAIGAVALGLVYMAIAGAPSRYLAINFAALAISLAMLALLGRTLPGGRRWAGGAIVAMAMALLATALLGDSADGASRWVTLGGLYIQPSLMLLPVMVVAFARCRNPIATAGIIVAAAALALQPDRAMAGMLAAGMAVLAIMSPDRHVIAGLGAGIASFVTTLARDDTLPAAPYVDQILYSSFDVHPAAGAAVLLGSALLLVPALVGRCRDRVNSHTYVVFGAVWLAAIIAAALGNYPTPIVGYGGSAIIGFALSLLGLPKQQAQARVSAVASQYGEKMSTEPERHLIVGLV